MGCAPTPLTRVVAVTCAVDGDSNCRHEWNRLHPDDPVTEDEQQAFADLVEGRLRAALDRRRP